MAASRSFTHMDRAVTVHTFDIFGALRAHAAAVRAYAEWKMTRSITDALFSIARYVPARSIEEARTSLMEFIDAAGVWGSEELCGSMIYDNKALQEIMDTIADVYALEGSEDLNLLWRNLTPEQRKEKVNQEMLLLSYEMIISQIAQYYAMENPSQNYTYPPYGPDSIGTSMYAITLLPNEPTTRRVDEVDVPIPKEDVLHNVIHRTEEPMVVAFRKASGRAYRSIDSRVIPIIARTREVFGGLNVDAPAIPATRTTPAVAAVPSPITAMLAALEDLTNLGNTADAKQAAMFEVFRIAGESWENYLEWRKTEGVSGHVDRIDALRRASSRYEQLTEELNGHFASKVMETSETLVAVFSRIPDSGFSESIGPALNYGFPEMVHAARALWDMSQVSNTSDGWGSHIAGLWSDLIKDPMPVLKYGGFNSPNSRMELADEQDTAWTFLKTETAHFVSLQLKAAQVLLSDYEHTATFPPGENKNHTLATSIRALIDNASAIQGTDPDTLKAEYAGSVVPFDTEKEAERRFIASLSDMERARQAELRKEISYLDGESRVGTDMEEDWTTNQPALTKKPGPMFRRNLYPTGYYQTPPYPLTNIWAHYDGMPPNDTDDYEEVAHLKDEHLHDLQEVASWRTGRTSAIGAFHPPGPTSHAVHGKEMLVSDMLKVYEREQVTPINAIAKSFAENLHRLAMRPGVTIGDARYYYEIMDFYCSIANLSAPTPLHFSVLDRGTSFNVDARLGPYIVHVEFSNNGPHANSARAQEAESRLRDWGREQNEEKSLLSINSNFLPPPFWAIRTRFFVLINANGNNAGVRRLVETVFDSWCKRYKKAFYRRDSGPKGKPIDKSVPYYIDATRTRLPRGYETLVTLPSGSTSPLHRNAFVEVIDFYHTGTTSYAEELVRHRMIDFIDATREYTTKLVQTTKIFGESTPALHVRGSDVSRPYPTTGDLLIALWRMGHPDDYDIVFRADTPATAVPSLTNPATNNRFIVFHSPRTMPGSAVVPPFARGPRGLAPTLQLPVVISLNNLRVRLEEATNDLGNLVSSLMETAVETRRIARRDGAYIAAEARKRRDY